MEVKILVVHWSYPGGTGRLLQPHNNYNFHNELCCIVKATSNVVKILTNFNRVPICEMDLLMKKEMSTRGEPTMKPKGLAKTIGERHCVPTDMHSRVPL